ncbi:MAG TPA: ATP-binding protein [Burkholderiales bacterium]|nr:ATP-binding protein [Burkholderiales bacterium]
MPVGPQQITDASAESQQALRIRRFLIASATYVLAIAVMALGAWFDIWDVEVLVVYSVVVVCTNLVFYLIIRSGLNLRLADPSLTAPQIAVAIGALLFAVYNAGPARSILMLWVVMIFLFAVFRLKSHQLWPLATLTWVAYGAVVGLTFRNHPETVNTNQELFQWIVLGTVLAWFTVMGGYISDMRARLRRNEIFYRSMWETAHDAVLISGPGGLIEYANPAVNAVFGRAPESLLGTAITALLAKKTPAAHSDEFRRYLEGGQAQRDWDAVELMFTHGEGGDFPAEVSVDEMTVENRRACLLFVRNILVRKQTEQALVDSRISAEAANRAKTQFLANMTHEIRTPLNGIIGMAEILQQEPLGGTASGYVDKIHRSGRALLGVVNDVLDFSKIEQGQLNVEREVFALPHVIQDVYDLYLESARAKNIELHWDVSRMLPPFVFGDPSRLRQILSNLVANAVKFTERGRVELRATPEGPDQVRFEIHDTGLGIPLDQQNLIFEAFVQVDGSATRRFGGAGLGLTITRQIVKLMGGEIGVDSEPGKGSRFWFTVTLPRASQRGLGDTGKMAAVKPALAQFGGKRILLVEDDESNAEIAMVLLRRLGPDVTHVANGALAVAAYREGEFDMVIMDCQMPVMDGLEATRQIRAIEKLSATAKRTPIAALTAHSFDGYRDECIAADMDDYMTKPVSTDDFLTMLNRWIGENASLKQKSA